MKALAQAIVLEVGFRQWLGAALWPMWKARKPLRRRFMNELHIAMLKEAIETDVPEPD